MLGAGAGVHESAPFSAAASRYSLGGFVIWQGLKLKLGTINDPGSGYVLFYTGILMCLFSAWLATLLYRSERAAEAVS